MIKNGDYYLNSGGAITPVGDPPNVIVASNTYVINSVSSWHSFPNFKMKNTITSFYIYCIRLFDCLFYCATGYKLLDVQPSYVNRNLFCDDTNIFAIALEVS